MITYADFSKEHKGLTQEQFLAKVRVPYLLMGAAPSPPRSSNAGFMTVKFTKERLQESVAQETLFAVEKRTGSNAFAMMITLGRASNNDLVVPDQRISKFHAYFRQVGSEWTISDANSRNGTFVDGVQVPTDKGYPITSGARIKVAKSLELEFLDPQALYARLNR